MLRFGSIKSLAAVFALSLIGPASYAQTCTLSVSKSPIAGDTAVQNFNTLQRAADYLANAGNASAIGVGTSPVTVCVYSGTYWAADAVIDNDAPSELLKMSKDVNYYDPHTYQGGVLADTLTIHNLHGTAQYPVTFMAAPGNSPVIMQTGYNGIDVAYDTSYIVIDGFTVYGITNDFANVNYTSAVTNRYSDANDNPGFWPYYDGNCITVAGDAKNSVSTDTPGIAISTEDGKTTLRPTVAQLSRIPSHITVQNNKVYGCGGAGIGASYADYIKILNNTVSGCSHYAIYGASGISLLDSVNVDGDTNTNSGFYKNVVTGNRSWGNFELVPYIYVNPHVITDGEGIIIDTNQNTSALTQSDTTDVYLPGYLGRTLVGSNVISGNGGPAVEILASYFVDVIDNSTYGNVRTDRYFKDPEKRSEFQVSYSAFVNAADNIFFATQPPSDAYHPSYAVPYAGDNTPVVAYSQGSIFLENNIVFANGATVVTPSATDPYGVTELNDYYSTDPWYVSPESSTWDTQANLKLYAGSPALSAGTGDGFDTVYLPRDFENNSFEQSTGAYALGAFAVAGP